MNPLANHVRRTEKLPDTVVAALGERSPSFVFAPKNYGKDALVTYMAGRSDFHDPQTSLVESIKNHVEWESHHGEVRSIDPSTVHTETKPPKINSIRAGHFLRAAMKHVRSAIRNEWIIKVWVRPERGGYFVLLADRVLYVQAGPGGHWKLARVPEEGLT